MGQMERVIHLDIFFLSHFAPLCMVVLVRNHPNPNKPYDQGFGQLRSLWWSRCNSDGLPLEAQK